MMMTMLTAVLATVNVIECPKCDKRLRILEDGRAATVNLARLKDDAPDEATLKARVEKMTARAEKLLALGTIQPAADPKIRPLMGWSSWNTFGIAISEEIILETARAMATNGLKEAGYTYVNIDDGFFWGHGEDGILRFHPQRFPRGMKPTVDGIHALGLKAGIYSDAGADTCGSMWGDSGSNNDKGGLGGGLYGHDAADCKLHFVDLGFDFIKVDYCGGQKLKLNEKDRYTEISEAIRATGRSDVRLNLCRWAFPGTWAADIAESWRTTGDIRARWKSLKMIINENLYLSAYAKPGHYNDMDMLEVGHYVGQVKSAFGAVDTGFTPDEEVTHFGMWCMLSSPLLIGCDVRTIPETTKRLVTNPYLLAVNQNDLGCQAYVAQREQGECYVFVKDADRRFGPARFVAVCNLTDREQEVTIRAAALDLGGEIDAFDLVEKADVGAFRDTVTVKVRPHASLFYRLDAEKRLVRTVYEAETAFLTDYQELKPGDQAGTAFPSQSPQASGGVLVRYLGNRETNDLIWKEVQVAEDGDYALTFDYRADDNRTFDVQVDGGAAQRVSAPATAGRMGSAALTVRLTAGVHAIRVSNKFAWAPDIDRMTIHAAAR